MQLDNGLWIPVPLKSHPFTVQRIPPQRRHQIKKLNFPQQEFVSSRLSNEVMDVGSGQTRGPHATRLLK